MQTRFMIRKLTKELIRRLTGNVECAPWQRVNLTESIDNRNLLAVLPRKIFNADTSTSSQNGSPAEFDVRCAMYPRTLEAILRNSHRVQTKYEGIWTSENFRKRVCQQLFDLFGNFDALVSGKRGFTCVTLSVNHASTTGKVNKHRKKRFRTLAPENKKQY